MRVQKEGEAMKVEGMEYSRQRERKVWDRFQLLECLHYFISRVCAQVPWVGGEGRKGEEGERKNRGEE